MTIIPSMRFWFACVAIQGQLAHRTEEKCANTTTTFNDVRLTPTTNKTFHSRFRWYVLFQSTPSHVTASTSVQSIVLHGANLVEAC
eukprot:6279619-Amphidinium_carterae.1